MRSTFCVDDINVFVLLLEQFVFNINFKVLGRCFFYILKNSYRLESESTVVAKRRANARPVVSSNVRLAASTLTFVVVGGSTTPSALSPQLMSAAPS